MLENPDSSFSARLEEPGRFSFMFQLHRIWITLHLQTPVSSTARSPLPACYSGWIISHR